MIAGIITGIVLFGLVVWANLSSVKKTGDLPPREASRYLVLRYFIRIAGLVVILGMFTWYAGLRVTIGILFGMVLGTIVFLVLSSQKPFTRLVGGREKSGPSGVIKIFKRKGGK